MQRLFYPLKYVLEKRDIAFDEDLAIIIKLMPEDLKYPASVKMTDAGVLRDYKIEVAINNQHPETIDQLENLVNRKVIVVLHHNFGKIIIGCNEMPLSIYSMMTIQLTHKATMALRLHAVETLFKGFTVICCPFKGV
jgi:hypothetical protein